MTNPTVESTYEGAAFARSENVDFVIAIGGGSPWMRQDYQFISMSGHSMDKLYDGQYSDEIRYDSCADYSGNRIRSDSLCYTDE